MTLTEQHATVRSAGGYMRTGARSLIKVMGDDRSTFLHNLTTNVVNSLQPGDGNYAFAATVQGRALFDLNLLICEEWILLDIDAGRRDSALSHFDKYLITEDLTLRDISADWTRFEALGPQTAKLVETLGMGNNFDALADVQHVAANFEGRAMRLLKDNVGPIQRAVFFVHRDVADAFAATLRERGTPLGMAAIDVELFEMIRIEAGRPTDVADIDDQVIPPETGQIERGISYVKGCYLGQEVIERMRSRDSMARQLVGLKIEGDDIPEHGAPLFAGGSEIGRITSICRSVALGSILALGYAKTAFASRDGSLQVATSGTSTASATIIELPLPAWQAS